MCGESKNAQWILIQLADYTVEWFTELYEIYAHALTGVINQKGEKKRIVVVLRYNVIQNLRRILISGT
jgi:hypothetical protein